MSTAHTHTWNLGEHPWLPGEAPSAPARIRVIVDNDFSGDPDDLFALAHQLLSPSTDVRLIVASHLAPGDPFDPSPDSSANAEARVHELLEAMGLDTTDASVHGGNRVVQGAASALADASTPQPSSAVEAIITEALRPDSRPLYYLAGGGLTDLASAYLRQPAIAERLTLVWIGGPEYPDLAFPPPGWHTPEYNLNIDIRAAQVIFNTSTVPLWQVPRDAYRQCLVSDIELRTRVLPHGPTGRLLYDAIRRVNQLLIGGGHGYPESYALGDSPLVLLTSLQSHFEADPSSSRYVLRAAPGIDDLGQIQHQERGRTVRVYTHLDVRLMFEDMFLKLAALAAWQGSRSGAVSPR